MTKSIKAGQRYTRPDGFRVRVDSVGNGQVYFVSWKPEQELGCPIRMPIPDFEISIRNERMSLAHARDSVLTNGAPGAITNSSSPTTCGRSNEAAFRKEGGLSLIIAADAVKQLKERGEL